MNIPPDFDWSKVPLGVEQDVVRTRNGEPVALLTVSGRGERPIIGYRGDSTVTNSWFLSGCMFPNGYVSDSDLVLAPRKREKVLWFNMYADRVGGGYQTRGIADRMAGNARRLARVRFVIPWTEGQFDE